MFARALSAGVTGYIIKPFSEKALLDCIDTASKHSVLLTPIDRKNERPNRVDHDRRHVLRKMKAWTAADVVRMAGTFLDNSEKDVDDRHQSIIAHRAQLFNR